MRSLERPDSLGKHFHSSRRISFFLFSIVPLCCLPLLPPFHLCPQASFALRQRQLLDASHVVPSGTQERKSPAERSPGCWGTPAATVGSALPVLACGCGKEGATELLLEASSQPQACPTPGTDGGVAGMADLYFSSSWSPVWDSEVCSAWKAGESLCFATKNMKVHEDGSLQSKYEKKSIAPGL